MLTTPHHFGITVSHGKTSRRFYHRVLRLPLMAVSTSRGALHDTMYRLEKSVNEVSWFQIHDQGTELFYLPRHPARDTDAATLARPGWRYAAFLVRGFDDYMERLQAKGATPRLAQTEQGRCARVQDPDGANILFFEDTAEDRVSMFDIVHGVGAVTGLAEAGLVVRNPEPYVRFFDAVGLLNRDAPAPCEFIPALFDYQGRVESEVYGRIRVIHLPDETLPARPCMFPHPGKEHIDYYPDLGLKHICYYVDDIRAFHERAATAGVHFLFPPARISGGARMAYFSDPEGHIIEAMEVPPALRRASALGGRARQAQMDIFSFVRRRMG